MRDGSRKKKKKKKKKIEHIGNLKEGSLLRKSPFIGSVSFYVST